MSERDVVRDRIKAITSALVGDVDLYLRDAAYHRWVDMTALYIVAQEPIVAGACRLAAETLARRVAEVSRGK